MEEEKSVESEENKEINNEIFLDDDDDDDDSSSYVTRSSLDDIVEDSDVEEEEEENSDDEESENPSLMDWSEDDDEEDEEEQEAEQEGKKEKEQPNETINNDSEAQKKEFGRKFRNATANGKVVKIKAVLQEAGKISNELLVHILDTKSESGMTPLMGAARNEQLKAIKYLLLAKADGEEKEVEEQQQRQDDNENTLPPPLPTSSSSLLLPFSNRPQQIGEVLRIVCRYGKEAIFQFIFDEILPSLANDEERKTALNHVDKFSFSALHEAVRSNQLEMVKRFASSPNIRDLVTTWNIRTRSTGETPLLLAMGERHKPVVDFLLSAEMVDKIDVNCVNREGETALHLAVQWDRLPIVQQILSHPRLKNANAVSNVGWTALHYATEGRSKAGVLELLIKNPRIDVQKCISPSYSSPPPPPPAPPRQQQRRPQRKGFLHSIADGEDDGKIVRRVFEVFSQTPLLPLLITQRDRKGRTALHIAVALGQENIVSAMINDNKMDVNVPVDRNEWRRQARQERARRRAKKRNMERERENVRREEEREKRRREGEGEGGGGGK